MSIALKRSLLLPIMAIPGPLARCPAAICGEMDTADPSSAGGSGRRIGRGGALDGLLSQVGQAVGFEREQTLRDRLQICELSENRSNRRILI